MAPTDSAHRRAPAPDSQPLIGRHAVAAAWANPARRIHALYCTQNAWNQLAPARAAAEAAGLSRPAPTIGHRKMVDSYAPAGTVHQGFALVCDPLPEPEPAAWLAEAGEKADLAVMLDRVTDPQNVGAVLRSAAAFGASALILQGRHSPPVTPALAKAASGAVEYVPILRPVNLARCLESFAEAGWQRLALAGEAPVRLDARPSAAASVLVLGAEDRGVRPGVRAACDALVRLPAGGPVAELNVSAAAAVGLYELARRRA